MMMMANNDVVNNFMNIVFTPVSLVTLFGFLNHFYSVYTRLEYIFRTVFKEDVTGKVVLITGASSGIGEHLAYEYAKKGACLALVARREDQLRRVAANAEEMGCPYALVLKGDVTKVEDCQQFVNATAQIFGRLDHLVTNAGVSPVTMFEDIPDITNLAPAMASKAALVAMYETLRVELGTQVGITIVTPGLIESEMTDGKFLNQQGLLQMDKEIRDVQVSVMPLESTAECAKAIVNSACRGDKYLTEPEWYRSLFWFKAFCPDVIEWSNRFYLLPSPGRSVSDAPSKKIADMANQFTKSIFGFMENLPWVATGSFLLDEY
ncbi:11-beta-hydroxysteroid dehydrogenase-like 6 [Linum perenne]